MMRRHSFENPAHYQSQDPPGSYILWNNKKHFVNTYLTSDHGLEESISKGKFIFSVKFFHTSFFPEGSVLLKKLAKQVLIQDFLKGGSNVQRVAHFINFT